MSDDHDPRVSVRRGPLDGQYDRLYETNPGFRSTADKLRHANWSKSDIVIHWEDLQKDDEAGDDDVP